VGSTDIHSYGKEMVKSLCKSANATVFDLGTYVTPQEIVENVLETESSVVIMSTYNGIALSFAQEVVALLKQHDLDVKLFLGGMINENQNGSSLAVDVSDEVKALGVNCDNRMETIISSVSDIYMGKAK
jgi:methylmalonyl-CoA mutase cobalamin-binding subunit